MQIFRGDIVSFICNKLIFQTGTNETCACECNRKRFASRVCTLTDTRLCACRRGATCYVKVYSALMHTVLNVILMLGAAIHILLVHLGIVPPTSKIVKRGNHSDSIILIIVQL